jgi:hypothetical protein
MAKVKILGFDRRTEHFHAKQNRVNGQKYGIWFGAKHATISGLWLASDPGTSSLS